MRRVGAPSLPVVLAAVAAGAGAALFLVPVAALAWRAPWSAVRGVLTDPAAVDAVRLSVVTSLWATAAAVVLGGPLAWVLARREFPGRRLLRAVVTVPMVLPPVVAGVALLTAFGRRGVLGAPLDRLVGVQLPFSTAGVVVAELFVAMPFLVVTLEAALRDADRRLEDAARTLGATPAAVAWRVTLPLVRPALVAGTVLCWARALGEFGATITFAGNFPGRTQTVPLAVFVLLEQDPGAAVVLSLVMLAVSVGVLVALRERWWGR